MKKSRQNIIFAVAFSLAVHIALGAALFYNLSANSGFPRNLNKLNLVWIALETKNNKDIPATGLRPVAGIPPKSAVKKIIAEEKPEIREVKQKLVETPVAPGFTGAVVLSDYDGHFAAPAKEQLYGLSGNIPGEAAGRPPVPVIAEAYPLYRENAPPVYPETARIRGFEGIVLIAAEILPDGRVGNMKIRKSSGYAILDASAVEAVKPWKFEPARRSGKPFAVWVELPIKFVLQDDNSQS